MDKSLESQDLPYESDENGSDITPRQRFLEEEKFPDIEAVRQQSVPEVRFQDGRIVYDANMVIVEEGTDASHASMS